MADDASRGGQPNLTALLLSETVESSSATLNALSADLFSRLMRLGVPEREAAAAALVASAVQTVMNSHSTAVDAAQMLQRCVKWAGIDHLVEVQSTVFAVNSTTLELALPDGHRLQHRLPTAPSFDMATLEHVFHVTTRMRRTTDTSFEALVRHAARLQQVTSNPSSVFSWFERRVTRRGPWGIWFYALAGFGSAIALFGGSWHDALLAAGLGLVGGLVVFVINASKYPPLQALVIFVATFLIGGLASYEQDSHRFCVSALTLGGLFYFLTGTTLVVGLHEIMGGHLQIGIERFVLAYVIAIIESFAVALGQFLFPPVDRHYNGWLRGAEGVCQDDTPSKNFIMLGFPLIAISIVLVKFKASARAYPGCIAVACATFAVFYCLTHFTSFSSNLALFVASVSLVFFARVTRGLYLAFGSEIRSDLALFLPTVYIISPGPDALLAGFAGSVGALLPSSGVSPALTDTSFGSFATIFMFLCLTITLGLRTGTLLRGLIVIATRKLFGSSTGTGSSGGGRKKPSPSLNDTEMSVQLLPSEGTSHMAPGCGLGLEEEQGDADEASDDYEAGTMMKLMMAAGGPATSTDAGGADSF